MFTRRCTYVFIHIVYMYVHINETKHTHHVWIPGKHKSAALAASPPLPLLSSPFSYCISDKTISIYHISALSLGTCLRGLSSTPLRHVCVYSFSVSLLIPERSPRVPIPLRKTSGLHTPFSRNKNGKRSAARNDRVRHVHGI